MPTTSSKRRTVVAVLVLLACVATIVPAARHRSSLEAPVALVPANDPVARLNEEISEQFGLREPVVWVLVARRGSVWTPTVLTRVQELTREVLRVPGVVAPDVISLASPNVRDFRASGDSLQPVYLMGRVPRTAAEIQRLRRRVESDANFNGTLVSTDGRAAMIVADFRPETDRRELTTQALALRDRYTDADTIAHVAGAPVLAAAARAESVYVAGAAAFVLSCGLLVLGLAAGGRVVLRALLATCLAATWSVGALIGLDAIVLPWSAYAILPTLLLCAVFVLAARPPAPRWSIAAGLLAGFVLVAAAAGSPGDAFGLAGGIGLIAAFSAAEASRVLVPCPLRSPPAAGSRVVPLLALLFALIAGLGLVRSHTSFSPFGHAVRYLPSRAAADLRAIEQVFPPPSALAVRVRGAAGFVKSPEVLRALDGATAAVRDDPAVVRSMSLADLVKMVHRAFDEEGSKLAAIPDQGAMIGRYLALGYSPGFRRFVDRAFTQTAIWVYVESDDREDLARVSGALRDQLDAHPVPGGEIEPIAGDGMVVLGTAAVGIGLALWGAGALLLCTFVVALLGGLKMAWRGLLGGALPVVVQGGLMGWASLPLDLVSLPLLLTVGILGAALAAIGADEAFYALGVMAGAAAVLAVATGNHLGTVFVVFLVAPLAPFVLTRRARWPDFRRTIGSPTLPASGREET